MMLKLQKRLAASVLRCSKKRVVFDPARLEDIKEAITKTDIRMLTGDGAIKRAPKKGVSRGRANKRQGQKRKGLRRGFGSRKGGSNARSSKKGTWMNQIRAQREFIQSVKTKLAPGAFKNLYRKSKGGFFRSVKHIKLFITENDMMGRHAKTEANANANPAIQPLAGAVSEQKQKPTIKKSKSSDQ
jgi:large subunit ribosomal protein L19e